MAGPDGTIVTGVGVTINKANMVYDGGAGKYYLDLEFADPNYKQTVNAVGGPSRISYSPVSQASFQIPPYVIRILKKTTPPTQDNGSSQVQSLYTSLASFNDQVYKRSDEFSINTYTAPGFGVGLVPYRFVFNSGFVWNYSDITQTDSTSSGTISVKFDANGGAEFTAGPDSGQTPYKQYTISSVSFPESISAFTQCNTFDINNGFTEPGSYLVVITRNAIQNQPNGGFAVDLPNSEPTCTGALATIQPPKTNVSYDSATDNLSFTITSYGSLLQATPNAWTITNAYYGTENFATPRYPYDVSVPPHNGTFPIEYITTNPSPRYSSLATLETSAKRSQVIQIEKTPTSFQAFGAFQYDFRIGDAFPPTVLAIFPYSSTYQSNGYVNYPSSSSAYWDDYMSPQFYDTWANKLQANPLQSTNILNYATRSLVDYSTNTITVPGGNSPIQFNTEIMQIGTDYLFHSYWQEDFQSLLTPFLVDASYVLRLYQKDPLSDASVNNTYSNNPVANYQYDTSTNTGLSVLPTWKTTSPNYTMDIYTDKAGNVYYNTAPSAGTFTGWSQTEISGAWIMVLQRNFTTAGSQNLDIALEGCYAVDVTDPSLVTLVDGLGDVTGYDTTKTIQYADASNIWNVYELDTGNTVILNGLVSNPDPTQSQLNDAYPLRQGPGLLTNRLVNKFNVGPRFDVSLGYYGDHVVADLSGVSQTSYDVSTNSVSVYDPKQSNEAADYLSSLNYVYSLYDSSKVYFRLNFNEPDYTSLRDEAYDINIFHKVQGTGTATSQWFPDGAVVPYVWISDASRGIMIDKSTLIPGQPNTILSADASGHAGVLLLGQSDFSGSFETGGYFGVVRRNFYKSTPTHPSAKEPYFTLNSQFIYVPPSMDSLRVVQPIYGSPDISLTLESAPDRFESTTPIYGSYNADGSAPDVSFQWFVKFEGFTTPEYINVTDLADTTGTTSSIPKVVVELGWAGLGTADMFTNIDYNWTAPSLFDLSIGEIGGAFRGIQAAAVPTGLLTPNSVQLAANEAVSGVYRYLLPDDISWNAANIVQNLGVYFVGDDTNRVMGIRWLDPSPNDLCGNWTGAPYALRLYKKNAVGLTPNSQWFSQDSSGIYPYQYEPSGSQVYEGVAVQANFFPQVTTNDYMYFFADACGNISYNQYYPSSFTPKPFTESGGYILVVQRHYQDSAGDFALSTVGHYINFISGGPKNLWALSADLSYVYSNPNPYSSFKPQVEGGEQDLGFSWEIDIPSVGYNSVIPGQDASSISLNLVRSAYRNRGGRGLLYSDVEYDFGLSSRPFLEHYPVLSIFGTGTYDAQSQPYDIDLCIRVINTQPPPWPRFSLNCQTYSPAEREQLQMRRKAETLFHRQNSISRTNTNTTNSGMTKKMHFAYVAKGLNQKKQTYATQTQTYTNPNTKGLPTLGAGLSIPPECGRRAVTNPSTASDVPGPTVPLTYDPSVPLVGYRVIRTYPTTQYDTTFNDGTSN